MSLNSFEDDSPSRWHDVVSLIKHKHFTFRTGSQEPLFKEDRFNICLINMRERPETTPLTEVEKQKLKEYTTR